MTHSDSIQNAYRWAFNVSAEKHTSCQTLLCARQVLAIVDQDGPPEAVYAKLLGLVREWHRLRKPGLIRAIEAICSRLGVTIDDVLEQTAATE